MSQSRSRKTIRTLVNGKVVQEDATDTMEWDMHYLVADLARTITLVPGDMIYSGTPANSRPVQPGDVVEVEVDGLGRLTNHIVEGPEAIRTDVGAQPTSSEEVVSTALGGGTIRDLILGRFPLGWTQHPEYIYLVISGGLLTTVIARYMGKLKRVFLALDAMGLVAFSLIGCSIALEMGYANVVVIMSGMITGICGGVVRDVLCNQVPVHISAEKKLH